MKTPFLLLAAWLLITTAKAQTDSLKKPTAADSLLNALAPTNKGNDGVIATFSSTRLVLSQTTETVKKNNLNFMVIHRFGDIGGGEGGGKTFWGLDNSSDIYIGFEYGLSNNVDIEFGRSKFEQMIDLGLKYALLHQKADDSSPIAISVVAKGGVRPYNAAPGVFNGFGDRLSYLAQAIFARRFSSAFSLQASPIFVRNNSPLPFIAGNEQQFFAASIAGRLKVTKRMSIILDYAHPFSSFQSNSPAPGKFYDSVGGGIEIETGGHVFTVNFTNAKAISAINYLSDTQSSWAKGQFRIGFTISRMFDFKPHQKNAYK